MKNVLWWAAALGALAAAARGQAPAGKPPAPAEPGHAEAPAKKVLNLPHIRVDLAKRQIEIAAEVAQRDGPLELVLCHHGEKEYESLLRTKAKPSHLHAALLALGLRPGKAAEWRDDKAIPPRGPKLKIRLAWKDKKGRRQEADPATWLRPLGDQKKTSLPEHWVFVGSLVLADGSYWADHDGYMISVANFAASVIDVPFESTDCNAALEFAAKTKAMPPKGTDVTVILTPLPGAEKCPHARAMLEIDRLGRLRLDGQPVAPDALSNWADKFVAKHAKAMVYIRTAARTPVFDVERARQALRLGGILEFQEEHMPLLGAALPRTDEQLARALAEWRQRFAHPEHYLRPPAEQAQAVARQIDAEIAELERKQELLRAYRRQLLQAAGTAPAEDGAGGKAADGARPAASTPDNTAAPGATQP